MLGLRLGLGFRVRVRVTVRVKIKNVYEFHEMLLCETHMCYSEMIRCCWRYVKV